MTLSGVDWGIALGVLGVILTIYFGLKAVKSSRTQNQTVRGGSTAVQSGRDTKIDVKSMRGTRTEE